MKPPLILGAGGFIGVNIADRFIERGIKPLCGRRKRSNVLHLRSRKLPLVETDLEQPETLKAAMEGVDLVIHAAGHYPRLSNDPEGAIALGRRQLKHALDAAAEAGVKRMVYVSTTATVAPNPEGGLSDERHVYAEPPSYGGYHRLKWEMEAMALAEDRFELLVACPTACIGPWDLRVATSAILVATARKLTPPHPNGVINLIDVRDAAEGVVRLAEAEAPPKRVIFSAIQAEVQHLLQQLALRYAAPAPSLPMLREEAIAFSDREEQKAVGTNYRPALSREIVDLILHEVPATSRYAAPVLGLGYRPFKDTLDAFDEWARRMRLIPSP